MEPQKISTFSWFRSRFILHKKRPVHFLLQLFYLFACELQLCASLTCRRERGRNKGNIGHIGSWTTDGNRKSNVLLVGWFFASQQNMKYLVLVSGGLPVWTR